MASGRIDVTRPTPDPRGCALASHTLPRGLTLRAADIVVAPNVPCPPGALPIDSLIGRVTRRVVQAGEPLREPAVAIPPAVAAGQSVDVIIQQNGVRITMRGTATASAAVGRVVWVRLGAKQRVQGVVAKRGVVIVSDTTRTQ